MSNNTRKKLAGMDRIGWELIGIHSDELTHCESKIVAILMECGILTFDTDRLVSAVDAGGMMESLSK